MLVLVAVLAALLFITAGRLNWPQACAFVVAFGVFLLIYAVWGALRDPALVEERGRVAANVKSWDKIIIGIYTAPLPVLFVVAGLDAGRFRWSAVPVAAQAIGWAGMALAGALVYWTVATNTYLSRLARIQSDRGQTVVTSGPYHSVRHPMYLGITFTLLGTSLGLGVPLLALSAGLFAATVSRAHIPHEEAQMLERFGGWYRDYTASARRWL